MRVAVLDAFGGLAGDMLLGALLDVHGGPTLAGEPGFLGPLRSLGLPEFRLEVRETSRRGIGALSVGFAVPPEHDHRHLPEILDRIERSQLPARARKIASDAFWALARAEGRVHRIPPEEVHFHEVGAADAILDICGVALAIERLDIETLWVSPLPAGRGTVSCAHGELPVPAPAVLELLGEFELLAGEGEGEMVTPTGAAILAVAGRRLPAGARYSPLRTGYGAGARERSVLRVTLAQAPADADSACEVDEVIVLETHLDDCSPEQLAWASERLFEAGALDVAFSPLVMKKGRPGVALSCVVRPAQREGILSCLFAETSTLGVREQRLARTVRTREVAEVETAHGRARVKVAGGRAHPEYEDCARIARAHGLALRDVQEEVLDAWRRR